MVEERIIFTEIDEKIQEIKDFEVVKNKAFEERAEAELNYIKANQKLRLARIELNKLMAQTKPSRHRFPSPDKLWKDRLIAEVGKCKECDSTEDLTVHHKIPLGEGGSNERDNIEILCRKCHSGYHPI